MKSFDSNSRFGDKAECPGCSGKVIAMMYVANRFVGGFCDQCNGLVGHGETYYDTLAFVLGNFLPPSYVPLHTTEQRYFDLTFGDGHGGTGRRHGFYDQTTHLLTQVG